jgi:hypothetical protein
MKLIIHFSQYLNAISKNQSGNSNNLTNSQVTMGATTWSSPVPSRKLSPDGQQVVAHEVF